MSQTLYENEAMKKGRRDDRFCRRFIDMRHNQIETARLAKRRQNRQCADFHEKFSVGIADVTIDIDTKTKPKPITQQFYSICEK